ncbi:MAG: hypothetical protein J3R72DRAFT_212658 [Linnemannia gamsii]|nr:MAG: hypothetical protein J3R72DRAFT_212658 [Linnemannia gamsii]
MSWLGYLDEQLLCVGGIARRTWKTCERGRGEMKCVCVRMSVYWRCLQGCLPPQNRIHSRSPLGCVSLVLQTPKNSSANEITRKTNKPIIPLERNVKASAEGEKREWYGVCLVQRKKEKDSWQAALCKGYSANNKNKTTNRDRDSDSDTPEEGLLQEPECRSGRVVRETEKNKHASFPSLFLAPFLCCKKIPYRPGSFTLRVFQVGSRPSVFAFIRHCNLVLFSFSTMRFFDCDFVMHVFFITIRWLVFFWL